MHLAAVRRGRARDPAPVHRCRAACPLRGGRCPVACRRQGSGSGPDRAARRGTNHVWWTGQELLARIAGEKAPTAFLSEATPDKRTAVADAWRGWWKDAGPRTDLAKIKLDETLLGINLICEIPPNESQGIVWACRADGKKLWEIRDVNAPVDAQLLPNGNVLIAEWGSTQVAERDRSGKVVWSHKLNQVPTSCRRLPNGNTFIGTYGEVLEVDPKGNVVYSYKDPNGGSCYRAHRLPNGHVVFATSNSTIVELDAKGMLVRSVKTPIPTNDWTSIDPLPGGRFLLAVRSSQKVIEIDTDGKIVWERTVRDPMAVARLPNGNTLVSSYFMNGEVIEIDRAGKDVWKLKIETRPFCASPVLTVRLHFAGTIARNMNRHHGNQEPSCDLVIYSGSLYRSGW